MRKDKKKITGIDIGVKCSIIGIIASIVLIVMNIIENESTTIGIVLLGACAANLAVNMKNKKDNQ